jgi:HD-like signal output (HDOD) protein
MGSEEKISEQKIGELLIAAELITEAELAEGLALQRSSSDRIVNVLMSLGALDSEEFLEFLSGPDSYPKIDMMSLKIDAGIIELIPEEIARAHEVIPVDCEEDILMLGMVCPLDQETIEMLVEKTGFAIRPFLCSSLDLHACLDQHYCPEEGDGEESLTNLGGVLKVTTAVTMIRHIESLPALPGTVQKVREMLLSDTGSAAEVGEVISRDPAIAAKMLKVANSAAYGFMQKVDTVELAVSLLGLLETYSVVVTSAVVDMLGGNRDFNYADFWMKSMLCAKLGKAIAQTAHVNASGIVLSGLLHDIGRIALVQLVPGNYGKVDSELEGDELVRAEEELLGLTHTEAGFQLALHWDFPDELAECIRFHHAPELAREQYRKSVAIIHIADTVSHAHRFGSQNRIPDLGSCGDSLDLLGISANDVLDLFDIIPDSDSDSSFM